MTIYWWLCIRSSDGCRHFDLHNKASLKARLAKDHRLLTGDYLALDFQPFGPKY